jgi:phosphate starvation-inducible PhoH-like protein
MEKIKKELKGDIKFAVQLNEEQKLVKAGVFEKDVSIILGDFGGGKTMTACYIALDLLFRRKVERIFITRPIDFEATGFIKGSIDEKLAFHIFPIKQNMYTCYNKQKIDDLFKDGTIQIIPIDYMKGITFQDSCTIVDEFEDISFEDFKLILTRLGIGSKLLFTGSAEQISVKDSCIHRIQCLKNCPEVNFHVLKEQHRNENILKILNHIKENA